MARTKVFLPPVPKQQDDLLLWAEQITHVMDELNLRAEEAGSHADHGGLLGLTDDDHTGYLLADGTRDLAGAWDLDNQNLTNVDIDSGNIDSSTVVATEWDAAYTHSIDNTQAHSDYLLNNASDETSGTLTAANFTTAGTVQGEQITSTDDIAMQGHLLTLGDGTATDIVISFAASANDATITFDESEDDFLFGDANIKTTGTVQAEHLYSTDDAVVDGSLVVDTNTLVVNADSYTNQVGIGTATPATTLHVSDGLFYGENWMLTGVSETVAFTARNMYLDLVSLDDTLDWGSAITFKEVTETTGAYKNAWAWIRSATEGTHNGDLYLTFGTSINPSPDPGSMGVGSNPAFLIVGVTGNFDFQNGNIVTDGSITTTGLGTFGNLDVDTLNFNGNDITDSTGTIQFGDEHLITTGNGTFANVVAAAAIAGGSSQLTFTEAGINFFRILHDGAPSSPDNLLRIQAANGSDGVLDVNAITITQVGKAVFPFEVRIGDTTLPTDDLEVNGITNLGDGGTTHYTEIKADGEVNLHGTARVKKEFTLPLSDFAPGASGATAALNGIFQSYEFGINDTMHTSFEVPTDCDTSEDLTIEVYWAIDEARDGTNQEVQWSATWRAIAVGESVTAGGASGTIDFGDVTIPVTANTLVKTIGTIAAASIAQGDLIALEGSRVALDGGNNPTAEPYIFMVNIEYYANKLGEAT